MKSNSKYTILTVDDNSLNLKIVDILLGKKYGYNIILAESGQKCLDILEKNSKIDLILLDVMMPEMNGFETLKKIKENNKFQDIPIIMLTAKTEIDDKIEAFDLGAVDYLTKPFEKKELLKRVETQIKIRAQYNLIKTFENNVREDLRKAKKIQLRLLPESEIQLFPFKIVSSYTASFYVGGDFYDFIDKKSHDSLVFFIADISGHGMASSFYSTITKMILTNLFQNSEEINIKNITEKFNKKISEYLEDEYFLTAILGKLEKTNLNMTLTNAGHHKPLLLRNNEIIEIDTEPDLFLGVFDDTEYKEYKTKLETGDKVLFFTDGIVELSVDDKTDFFTKEDFFNIVRENIQFDSRTIIDNILYQARQIINSEYFDDDISMFILEIMPYKFRINSESDFNTFFGLILDDILKNFISAYLVLQLKESFEKIKDQLILNKTEILISIFRSKKLIKIELINYNYDIEKSDFYSIEKKENNLCLNINY